MVFIIPAIQLRNAVDRLVLFINLTSTFVSSELIPTLIWLLEHDFYWINRPNNLCIFLTWEKADNTTSHFLQLTPSYVIKNLISKLAVKWNKENATRYDVALLQVLRGYGATNITYNTCREVFFISLKTGAHCRDKRNMCNSLGTFLHTGYLYNTLA